MAIDLSNADPRLMEGPAEAAEYFHEAAISYVAAFPDARIGLDTPRVEQFVASNGYSIARYVITTLEEYISRRKQFEHNIGLAPGPFDDTWAWYIPSYRVATLLRRPDLDRVNGVTYSESTLVHELVHAGEKGYELSLHPSSQIPFYVELSIGLTKATPKRWLGMLLNEMVAAYHQQEYIMHYSGLGIYNKDSDDVETWPTLPTTRAPSGKPIPLSPFACHLDALPTPEDGTSQIVSSYEGLPIVTRNSAIAGSCLKLLAMADPEIVALLSQGLNGEVAKQALADRINMIEGGLYEKLLILRNNQEDAMIAAETVWTATKSKF